MNEYDNSIIYCTGAPYVIMCQFVMKNRSSAAQNIIPKTLINTNFP